MYAYIKGDDNHLRFSWFNKRKDAEIWLKNEINFYLICYRNYEAKVITNRQFKDMFSDEKMRRSVYWSYIGKKLRDRILELRSQDN